jgi:DNA-binding transcriptional regulator LsrR (DeoR family)
MYYVAGLTQQDIASALGLSRQVAQRLISGARETGMVTVNISHPVTRCLKLAHDLQEKYALNLCRVVPSAGLEDEAIQQMLAVEGAQVMAHLSAKRNRRSLVFCSGKWLRQ